MKKQPLTWKIELIIISVFLIALCGCHKDANNDQIQNDGIANNTTSTEFDSDTVPVDDEVVGDSNVDFEKGSSSEEPTVTLEPSKATDAASPQSSIPNNATDAHDSFETTSTPSPTPSGGSVETVVSSPTAENSTEPDATSTPWDGFDQGEWDTDD